MLHSPGWLMHMLKEDEGSRVHQKSPAFLALVGWGGGFIYIRVHRSIYMTAANTCSKLLQEML